MSEAGCARLQYHNHDIAIAQPPAHDENDYNIDMMNMLHRHKSCTPANSVSPLTPYENVGGRRVASSSMDHGILSPTPKSSMHASAFIATTSSCPSKDIPSSKVHFDNSAGIVTDKDEIISLYGTPKEELLSISTVGGNTADDKEDVEAGSIFTT